MVAVHRARLAHGPPSEPQRRRAQRSRARKPNAPTAPEQRTRLAHARERRVRRLIAAEQRTHEQWTRQQDAVALDVAPHGSRHQQTDQARAEVDERAGAKLGLPVPVRVLAWQHGQESQHDRCRRREGEDRVGLRAAFGEQRRQGRQDERDRRDERAQRPRRAPGRGMRERDQHEQSTGDRTRGRAQGREHRRRQAARVGQREHRSQRQRDPEGKGQAPDPDVRNGRQREPRSAPARPRSVRAQHEPLEQSRRGHRRDHRQRAQAHERRERREQHAVAREQVTRVPVLVPDPKAEALEQLHAVDSPGEIGGARIHQKPRHRACGCESARAWHDAQRVGEKIDRDPVRYPTGPRPDR